jgi:hypothetical protein
MYRFCLFILLVVMSIDGWSLLSSTSASNIESLQVGNETKTEKKPGINDPLLGKTIGVRAQDPGEFTSDGWRVTTPTCQIKYDLGKLYQKGTVEFEIKGELEQEPKRIVFAAWDKDYNSTPEKSDSRESQSFFQVRIADEGMVIRITDRGEGGTMEKHTGPLKWGDKDKWVHVKATWDTRGAGGVSRLWRDGIEVRHGIYKSKLPGFRWVYLGRDNYGNGYRSVPGFTFRNLKVYDLE